MGERESLGGFKVSRFSTKCVRWACKTHEQVSAPTSCGRIHFLMFLTSSSHKFILIRQLFCFQLVCFLRRGLPRYLLCFTAGGERGWGRAEGITPARTAGYHRPGPSALIATLPSQLQSIFNHLTCTFLTELSSRNELLLI